MTLLISFPGSMGYRRMLRSWLVSPKASLGPTTLAYLGPPRILGLDSNTSIRPTDGEDEGMR